jgi:hypothetical protein
MPRTRIQPSPTAATGATKASQENWHIIFHAMACEAKSYFDFSMWNWESLFFFCHKRNKNLNPCLSIQTNLSSGFQNTNNGIWHFAECELQHHEHARAEKEVNLLIISKAVRWNKIYRIIYFWDFLLYILFIYSL